MDRRTLLQRSVVFAVAGLAGCASDPDEPTATPEPTDPVETTALPTTAEPVETPTGTASPTAAATDASTGSPTGTATATSSPPSPTATPAEADQVVVVGADSSLRFEPDSFTVEAGATVLWRWDAGGHNVKPDSIPEDASWTGTSGGDGDTYSSGYTHSHTFDVPGEYEYYCGPHRNAGMTGSFAVE